MRVYPTPHADHLKAGLRPCHLVLGDQPRLNLQEQAVDLATHPLNQVKC